MAQKDTDRQLQPQCLRRFDASTQVPKTRKMGGGKSLPDLAGLHVLLPALFPYLMARKGYIAIYRRSDCRCTRFCNVFAVLSGFPVAQLAL